MTNVQSFILIVWCLLSILIGYAVCTNKLEQVETETKDDTTKITKQTAHQYHSWAFDLFVAVEFIFINLIVLNNSYHWL